MFIRRSGDINNNKLWEHMCLSCLTFLLHSHDLHRHFSNHAVYNRGQIFPISATARKRRPTVHRILEAVYSLNWVWHSISRGLIPDVLFEVISSI